MRDPYDFSGGKRGAVLPSPGKKRISIMIYEDVGKASRLRGEASGPC